MNTKTKPTVVILSESERILPVTPLIKELIKNKFNVIVYFKNEIDLESSSAYHPIHKNRAILFNLSNVKVEYIGSKRCWLVKKIRRYFYRPNMLLFKIFMKAKYFTIGQLLFEWDLTSTLKFQEKTALSCFNNNNVCSLIAITDKNFGNAQLGFIKAANQVSIPVILPHLHYRGATIRSIKGNRKYTFDNHMSLYQKKVFEKYSSPQYGKQLYENYFFYPAYCLIAIDKAGVLSKNPWMIGAGSSDIVIADHQHTVDRYNEALTPLNKLHILGDFAFDPLFKSYENRKTIRKDISNKYQLKKNKIFIIALPPLFEHNILSEENHWNEIDFIIATALKNDVDLLISLHPKMNINDYSHLEDLYDLKIIEEKLHTVLPIADIFISALSTTILWSVICGINTIMVGFSDFDDNIYSFLNSIEFIENRPDLSPAITKLLTQKIDFDHDWKLLSRESVFDGQVIKRHVDLMHQLVHDKSNFIFH